MELIREYEGKRPPSLDLFLEHIGLDEEEFFDIAMSHQVSPYVHDPARVSPGEKMPDFDRWPRHGAVQSEDARIQLERWRNQRSASLQAAAG